MEMEMKMEMEKEGNPTAPHVLIFPFPGQGHVNSMLKLAQLLSFSGIRVTFLNFDSHHHLLLRNPGLRRLSPALQFSSISDGLPPDHPRTVGVIGKVFESIKANTAPLLRDLLLSFRRRSEPVTCIIADGIMISFTADVAAELCIPIVAFRTISACAFWSYFCMPDVIDAGELPFHGGAEMDAGIRSVPGMEAILRRRDLPRFFRGKEQLDEKTIRDVIVETRSASRASALILNTFEDLEGPVLSHIRRHCHTIYTLGPIHSLLRSKLPATAATATSSLREEDRSCIAWLDAQPARSVVYVSFGSYTIVTHDQLMEFWHGLVSSGYRFLWARRPDMVVAGEDEREVPAELVVAATRERGCVVEWAPQEEVLNHPAVAGFLTHSGWNSTLESIVAGVPMLCWPFFADQQVNSRFVGEAWGLGLDMKDRCDRQSVERMVVELMEGEALRESARRYAGVAAMATGSGGSSSSNLDKLVDDIKSMRLELPTKLEIASLD